MCQTWAIKDFDGSLVESRALQLQELIAQNLLNKGMTQCYCGDYIQSIECLEEALFLWQKINDTAGQAYTLSTLAEVYSALGDYQKAVEYLQTADERIQEIGDKDVEVEYLNTLGAVHCELGDYEGALDSYLQMEALAKEVEQGYFLVQGKLGLSRTHIALCEEADLENARRYATEAINLCQELQLAGSEPRGHAYLSKANLLLGDKETVLQNCREAMHLLDKQKHVHGSEAQIYQITVQVLAANGLEDERRRYLKQAYDLVQATAAEIEDKALRQSYLAVPVNREIVETWEREAKAVGLREQGSLG